MVKIKRIEIRTIPHDSQRYPTAGDWAISEDGTLRVAVSELGDHRMSMACGIHEAIEALLCNLDGVDQDAVTAFDEAYEGTRYDNTQLNPGATPFAAPCGCVPTADSEPGEDPHAPYRLQHAFADGVERLLAMELGIVWAEYADKTDALDYRGGKDAKAPTEEG